MSTLTQVTQGTPTTPSANQVVIYPKSDNNFYIMGSDGIEKLVVTNKFIPTPSALLFDNLNLTGGL